MTTTGRHGLAPGRSERLVEALLREAATRAERLVCIGRVLLVSAVVIRLYWLWSAEGMTIPASRAITLYAWLGAVFAASLFTLLRYRRRSAPSWLLWLSMIVDTGACFVALLSNSLWPGPRYAGNLVLPDIAFIAMPIIGSGLRLSLPLAATAGALGFLSLAVLAGVDASLFPMGTRELAMRLTIIAVMLFTVTACAVLTVYYTRRLALDSARRALRVEKAEWQLGELMREHHDARTLLSAAALDAELVERRLSADAAAGRVGQDLPEIAGDLRDNLDALNALIHSIRERAYDEVASRLDPHDRASTAVLHDAAGELRKLHDPVEIVVDLADGPRAVAVPGGETVLRRVLHNLVVNACEGDGRRGASRVTIAASFCDDGRGVRIEVSDDGPGFPGEMLSAPLSQRLTTKRDGSGLGLWLVHDLLGDRAETLRRSNRPEGGASVSFVLPSVADRPIRSAR